MPDRGRWSLILILAGVLIVAGGVAGNKLLARQHLQADAAAMTGGSPQLGRGVIQAKSCGGCHQIPGVAGARGTVGPPLAGIAGRAYLAGRLENTPPNLIRWVQDPHGVDPQTAMPNLGLTDAEARHVAAYLETLR